MKISKLKNASRALALSFPFLVLSLALPALPAEGRDIYVRLANDPAKVALTSDEPMTLIDAANKSHTLGKSAVLMRSGSSLVSGKDKFPLPARVSGGLLGYNGRKYRGLLLLTKNFVLLNVLNVEDYLQGVLPAEASAAWPKEYLKVQAILSRTYALRQSLNRSARGYDVTDDTSSQVYRGAGVEAAASNQAVRESAGQVLTYENDLAFTFFHSDSGGHTADNAHVWGRAVPYLKGVKEPIRYDSPNADWSVRLSSSQVEAALSKLGRGVGQVREIRVAEADKGGRAVTLRFTGSAGSSSARASDFRTAVGPNLLKSTMLTWDAPPSDTPEPAKESVKRRRAPSVLAALPVSDVPLSGREEASLIRMTEDGIFSAAELMDMLKNPDKKKAYLYLGLERGGKKTPAPADPAPKKTDPPQDARLLPTMPADAAIPFENGNFVFRGRGWGHGVGLSQWGAQALARQGWTAERILEHYFPGTAIKRIQ